MPNSTSNISSAPVSVPVCDAWGYMNAAGIGAASLIDSAGLLSVARKSAGIYGVSFSNASAFGGGAYVILTTPETEGYETVITATDSWMNYSVSGPTAAGRTHGVEISTWKIPSSSPSPGGYTASLEDVSALRVNFAAFALKTNTELYSEIVKNYFTGSEDLTNLNYWSQAHAQNSNTANITQVGERIRTPSELNQIYRITGDAAGSGTNFIIQTPTGISLENKTMTFSAFAKADTGVTFWLYIGSNGNGFYGIYNLQNTTASVAGSATGAVFSANITDIGEGWKRCSLTFNTPLGPGMIVMPGHNNGMNEKSVYVSGLQLEEGKTPTEYIRTTNTAVTGNQDIRKRLVPGASGFGVTGATYNSHLPNLLSKRSAIAYGTIVCCPAASNATDPIVSLENSYNVKTVTAQANSEYTVQFLNPLNHANYCVIVCGEQEPFYSTSDWTEVGEYPLFHVIRGTSSSRKSASQFSIVKLHQHTLDGSWARRSERYQRGFRDRVHFMVFGGGTYGQP